MKYELLSLFEESGNKEKIYVEFDKGSTHYVYGPFDDEKSAKKAAYLNRSVDDRDEAKMAPKGFLFRGVSWYTQDELDYYSEDPGAANFKKFVVKPAKSIPIHPSWKKIGLDFADELFQKDLK